MSASDHLNKQLFHGSSTRYGVVRPGGLIMPLANLEKYKEHAIGNYYTELPEDVEEYDAIDDYYPEAYGVAHATPDFSLAQNYARWSAFGGVQHDAVATPIVYEVHPAEDMEPDEYDDGSFVSPKGFRVKNIAWIDDSNVPKIKKKGE